MIALEPLTSEPVRTLPVGQSKNNRDARARLSFLDWTRGIAVIIMLQGHVFDSFTRPEERLQGPYVISQFFGGIGPAIFLVLTGITLAFIMDGRERKGVAPLGRWTTALRRSGYLFGLAFLFRLQLWLFAHGQSPWTDLLKVDVLNLMGFSVAVLSTLAFYTTAERARYGAVIGCVIAAAAPLASMADWSSVPEVVANYFVPSFKYFSFFPWAAFIAFGVSLGSILRLAGTESMNRLMQWGALLGFGLILSGQYFSNLPYSVYPKTDFWLNSPGLICIKLGAVLVLLAAAYVWNEYAVRNRWSWVRQFGITSLLVYWVHIELVYGRWFGGWKLKLTAGQCALAACGVILLMLALSVARTRFRQIKLPSWRSLFATYPAASGASGD